jgi:hypothetical protein
MLYMILPNLVMMFSIRSAGTCGRHYQRPSSQSNNYHMCSSFSRCPSIHQVTNNQMQPVQSCLLQCPQSLNGGSSGQWVAASFFSGTGHLPKHKHRSELHILYGQAHPSPRSKSILMRPVFTMECRATLFCLHALSAPFLTCLGLAVSNGLCVHGSLDEASPLFSDHPPSYRHASRTSPSQVYVA